MVLQSLNVSRSQIADTMQQCRIGTLKLFAGIDDSTFRCQAHPEFSPAGWHLGHIGYTEALWLLQHSAKMPPLFPQYHQLFAADGLPKSQRGQLPSFEELIDYLDHIRQKVLTYLETADLETSERLWRFIIQHESQHGETIAFVLHLQKWSSDRPQVPQPHPLSRADLQPPADTIEIPAGEFLLGSDRIDALDNERSQHWHFLPTYWIDRYPVTCAQYRQFITAGGYHNPRWWSQAGWQWLQQNPVEHPLYWSDSPTQDHHPVCGVSWYEADAYARFIGKRLPTEAEWEKAACWDETQQTQFLYPWGNNPPAATHCNHDNLMQQTTAVNAYPAGVSPYGCFDMLGNVWEWTSSCFTPYPQFTFYPYPGYSQVYFDNQHQVLRGGSWATRPWALRCTFRNWYHPGVRQILAGFRCASS